MFVEYLDDLRSRGKCYFTFKDILKELKISTNSALSGLYRMKNKGKLISPAKGLYVIIPPEHLLRGCIPAEELVPILMKYLNAKYYVALLSAAAFYGAAHQKVSKFQVITSKRINRPLEFGEVTLDIVYKKSLDNLPLKEFAVATGYLKVASPELIALDLLHYQNKSGGLNHIATVLAELTESISNRKLIELAKFIKEKAWLQRLGFILTQIDYIHNKKAINIIGQLQKYLSNKELRLVPLALKMPLRPYNYTNKWKIIENTNIESDL